MTSLQHVLKEHHSITKDAYNLVEKKGRDYNRKQQKNGDTLFNMAVAKHLGITDTVCQGIMVRLSDKFMRLASLTVNPKDNAAVSDEKIRDTILDTINYLIYLKIKYDEERSQK